MAGFCGLVLCSAQFCSWVLRLEAELLILNPVFQCLDLLDCSVTWKDFKHIEFPPGLLFDWLACRNQPISLAANCRYPGNLRAYYLIFGRAPRCGRSCAARVSGGAATLPQYFNLVTNLLVEMWPTCTIFQYIFMRWTTEISEANASFKCWHQNPNRMPRALACAVHATTPKTRKDKIGSDHVIKLFEI